MSSEKSSENKPEHPAPLLAALGDLSAWLLTTGVSGAVIGGRSLFVRPSAADARRGRHGASDEGKWPAFLATGEGLGFMPRLSDALVFARKARVLLVRHEPSGIDVDVAFGGLPFEEEAIARAKWVEVGGIRIPLPTTEDLIIMKAVAHRPRDISDIEALLDVHPKLDTRRIGRWVREFSVALDMPEILRDLKALLAKRRKKK